MPWVQEIWYSGDGKSSSQPDEPPASLRRAYSNSQAQRSTRKRLPVPPPSPPSPSPPPQPQPYSASHQRLLSLGGSEASFRYDNGTGRLAPEILRQVEVRRPEVHRLPSGIQAPERLSRYISSSPDDRSSYSRLRTSLPAPPPPPKLPPPPPPKGGQSLQRSSSARSTRSVGIWSGLNSRYYSPPVSRPIPIRTRQSQWQGHWLQRGTLRSIPEEELKERARFWIFRRNKASPPDSVALRQDRETSGWYSSSDE